MNHLAYQYSLCAAIPLMLFFAFCFFTGKTPEKSIYGNYLRSRRTMGAALLVLAANYAVHLFVGIRFVSHNSAILLNLSTYFLSYWLFSSSLTTLLNRFYITRRRLVAHLSLWLLYTLLAACILFFIPAGSLQNIGTAGMAVWLFAYGIWLARRLLLTYRKATRSFADIHSDNIQIYVRWMSVITYWAVIYGISCGLFTFLPDGWVFLWVLSSIPFYCYLYSSFYNYLLFYEQIERVLEADEEPAATDWNVPEKDMPQYHEHIAKELQDWMEKEAYTQPGFTINDMARTLNTNRTYLSAYIKENFNLSFRDWVTELRLAYAKQMLTKYPDMSVKSIAEASGFLSMSHFIKTFTEKEGYTPAKWRKQEAEK